MLKITTESNGKTKVTKIIVIDSHSHMGKDVDGHEMMNPMQAGQGTFDFWGRIEHLILKDWTDGKASPTYSTVIKGVPTKVKLEFEQMPIIKRIYKELQKRNKSGNYAGFWDRIQYQNLIDQGIVFPFQDVFRNKKPEALYRASNINISRQVSKFPVSLRLNGYIRLHPDERKKALDEIDYWANQTNNIRGLKLHPRSEGWLDKISSQNAINVIIKAASYNWPVIFDTRGRQSILDIGDLVIKVRELIKKQHPNLLSNLKIIIAHAAAGNIDDFDVYNAIAQPNTYMDMSLCQGKTVERFFKGFHIWCDQNGVKQRTGRDWSEFCMYGSDYTYFQESHAKAFFDNILYSSFFEDGGNLQDIINILGLNQLKLFPEYGKKINFTSST
ncbi:MAG: amidohydrolase family protein, partial [Promethearchaeota archaeon]